MSIERIIPLLVAIVTVVVVLPIQGSAPSPEQKASLKWTAFPNPCFEVCGLPWFVENSPQLWRLPQRVQGKVRGAVWSLAQATSGGRIRFQSNTSQLKIRCQIPNLATLWNMSSIGSRGLDVYVDGQYWNSVSFKEAGFSEKTLFYGADRKQKQITIYLPIFQQIQISAIGVDEDTEIKPASPFALNKPIVYYGSSILQGGCACRPGMSYPAILSRRFNLDYVNLGFSGNGRAEPEVVSLVNEIDACCFIFDLGKSFRRQPMEVYSAMIETIHTAHPQAPIICISPIFSTREFYDDNYLELCLYIRDVVRQAVSERLQAGDKHIHLVEGFDLLGPQDTDAFHEGVHPTDLGFHRLADRLQPLLKQILPPTDKNLPK